MIEDLSYSNAIEQIMLHNGYYAPLKLLYKEIWNYKDKSKITWRTPDNTIQGVVQTDPRFTRIAKWVYALTVFIETLEKEELGFLEFKDNKIVFRESRNIEITEKVSEQKIRIWQSTFRDRLFSEIKKCPITWITEKRLLIASHIKPWVYSSNEERINPKNGLLLSPLYDKLFDKWIGFITFTLDKRVLISNRLSRDTIMKLGIEHNQFIPELQIDWREEFLEFHRKHIFQW